MARGWMTGVLIVAFAAAAAESCWAQGARNWQPRGTSLAERLSQLKDSWLGDDSAKPLQNSRQDREPAVAREQPPRPILRSDRSRRSQTLGIPRVHAGDLLPPGLFSRTDESEPQDDSSRLVPEKAPSPQTGNSLPHATSNSTIRRSPVTERENELKEALADLVPSDAEKLEAEQAGPLDVEEGEAPLADESVPPFLQSTEVANRSSPRDDELGILEKKASQSANSESSQQKDELSKKFDVHSALLSKSQQSRSPEPAPDKGHEKAPVEKESGSVFVNQKAPASSGRTTISQSIGSTSPTTQQEIGGSGVLFTHQQPVIVSHVEGPRKITVGREANYQVKLQNTSATTAQNLVAEIQIPASAEIVEAMSTSGVVESRGATSGDSLQWQLKELPARSSQTLSLKLIPRSGRPLQLAVQWSQSPIASRATVEVQEPKLEMDLAGPEDVLFGESQRYSLILKNPGTGVAENVVIELVPPGSDEESAVSHTVGPLLAGEEKKVDLELTARDAGELVIQATATAEGGLQAEAVQNVVCRKPELQIDWRGPQEQFAGTTTAYYFRVRNTGTAKTEPGEVRLELPPGIQVESATDGYKQNEKTGAIVWQIPEIKPGEEEYLELRCQIEESGLKQFDVIAETKSGSLKDAAQIKTNVVAIADLKLNVSDPTGPVAVGETVSYEVRIRNRGTREAKNVHIVGLFSQGIDPTEVEGAQFSVHDGRVAIHPVKSLPAGQELVIRIRAVASQEGTHIFRAEVTCEELELKLASEETTRFYEDKFRWSDGQTPYTAERESNMRK